MSGFGGCMGNIYVFYVDGWRARAWIGFEWIRFWRVHLSTRARGRVDAVGSTMRDGREKRPRDDAEAADARARKKEAKRAKKEAKRAKKDGGGGGDGDAGRDEDVRAPTTPMKRTPSVEDFRKEHAISIANACAKTKDLEPYTTFEEATARRRSRERAPRRKGTRTRRRFRREAWPILLKGRMWWRWRRLGRGRRGLFVARRQRVATARVARSGDAVGGWTVATRGGDADGDRVGADAGVGDTDSR